jgi:hypothetical protein
MTYMLLLIFVYGNSLTAVPLGKKTYAKLEDCLTAARAATQQEHFSDNYIDVRAVGYCTTIANLANGTKLLRVWPAEGRGGAGSSEDSGACYPQLR